MCVINSLLLRPRLRLPFFLPRLAAPVGARSPCGTNENRKRKRSGRVGHQRPSRQKVTLRQSVRQCPDARRPGLLTAFVKHQACLPSVFTQYR
ncbi:hypothetical protein B0H14DRAFT_3728760 [Mycena olivaceomarginata]|nr:hypothetical protein B0H14DRAFT_3728760 [Mycena olivaceomarginata]